MPYTQQSSNSQEANTHGDQQQRLRLTRIMSRLTSIALTVTIVGIALFQAQPASSAEGCKAPEWAFQILKLTNDHRAQYRLKPLRLNCRLLAAAQRHTFDMVKMGKMTHAGSDGSKIGQRVKRVGYDYRSVAENVAWGQDTVQRVVHSWMNSPGHRQNILNPNYTEMGIGYSQKYWTQVFGQPS
jgi:uncharacterized protein YkwD